MGVVQPITRDGASLGRSEERCYCTCDGLESAGVMLQQEMLQTVPATPHAHHHAVREQLQGGCLTDTVMVARTAALTLA